ncbi:MAG: 5-formyltetrahydrofolate cyclo-ligase [Bacteroidales bacterium]
MDIKQEKKELRKIIREKKKIYSTLKKKVSSYPIFECIERTKVFRKANYILMYWSMEDEVFTHDFINKWYKNKSILLPCVVGNDLVLKQYGGLESMIEGEQFSILEPQGEIFQNYSAIDLMIIPGVAFDTEKRRLGRGRGFYDRLLKTHDCCKIGICFDFQLVKKVPVEEFDIKMDKIIAMSSIH